MATMSDNGQISATANLSPEQRKALAALASGATKQAAALAAGRSRTTLDRWLRDEPEFEAALRAATNDTIHDAGRRMAGLLDNFITAVEKDLTDGDMDTRHKLRALDIIARHVVNLRQLGELEERIRALEERANGQP